ncbi:MAG: ABC transporter ATP-binding protein [Clostridium sp.]|nr:ABC transporter ATP-binding protein [Clostridium sp.]
MTAFRNLSVSSERIKTLTASVPVQAVSARHVSKTYCGRSVLSDISLTVQPGERCALMAPSGTGKTTLFRLLLGLEKADQGQIQTSTAGAVFQENRLIDTLSPIENVRLVLPSLPKEEIRAELFCILSSLLPEESLTRPVETLSGGMKRRCALARALLSPSKVLILDEPFTGLDETTKKQVIQFIKTWQKGRPLLFSTHDPEDVLLLQARLLSIDWNQR